MVLGYSRAPYRFQKDLVLAKEFSLLHETCSVGLENAALVLFNFCMATSKNLLESDEKLIGNQAT